MATSKVISTSKLIEVKDMNFTAKIEFRNGSLNRLMVDMPDREGDEFNRDLTIWGMSEMQNLISILKVCEGIIDGEPI